MQLLVSLLKRFLLVIFGEEGVALASDKQCTQITTSAKEQRPRQAGRPAETIKTLETLLRIDRQWPDLCDWLVRAHAQAKRLEKDDRRKPRGWWVATGPIGRCLFNGACAM